MIRASIIIPVYNEQTYIAEVIRRVSQISVTGVTLEIIIVDDGSTDNTVKILQGVNDSFIVILHQKNQGKGAAIRTGLTQCHGDIVAIQDADLEYDPQDLVELIELVANGSADVVYGSRMIKKNPIGHWAYYAGNWLISFLTRLLYGVNLTDVETGYKIFRQQVISEIIFEQNDFGFEIEVTAKLLKRGVKIIERPISYQPRSFAAGKKINAVDGIKALWLVGKYRLLP